MINPFARRAGRAKQEHWSRKRSPDGYITTADPPFQECPCMDALINKPTEPLLESGDTLPRPAVKRRNAPSGR